MDKLYDPGVNLLSVELDKLFCCVFDLGRETESYPEEVKETD